MTSQNIDDPFHQLSRSIPFDAKMVNTEQNGCLFVSCSGFPGDSVVKNPPAHSWDLSSIPGSRRSLEKEMATHSRILAWRIPWTEEPGGLQSTRGTGSDTTERRQAGYICPVEGLLGQMVVLVSSFLAAKGVRCKRPEGEQVGRRRGDGEGHYELCNCFGVCINITPRLLSPSISPKYIPLLSYLMLTVIKLVNLICFTGK